MPHLGLVTVVVGDYDEAIAFYVDALGFDLLEDTRLDAPLSYCAARTSRQALVGGFGGREFRLADDPADPQPRVLDLGMGRQRVG
jgi:catechol 2,3-dioxygenase-like lactoylglutathione lyase family enzyme